MKVFIAESGAGSRIVAEEMAEVLPLNIQGVQTFLAKSDLRKGVQWRSELLRQVQECDAGLFCINPESVLNPWFNFEGGLLLNAARNRDRLIFAYVINGSVPDSSPFSLFQLTQANEKETLELFKQLNEGLEKRVDSEQLRALYTRFWPYLKTAITSARRLSRGNGNGNGRS